MTNNDQNQPESVPVKTPSSESPKNVAASRLPQPFEELERALDRFFKRGWTRTSEWDRPSLSDLLVRLDAGTPRVDVIDRADEVLVRAEVPGVDKRDLEISMTDNNLTIKGKYGTESEQKDGDHYHRYEVSRGTFSRTVSLPVSVTIEQASANLKDGVVEIVLPKTDVSKRKTIPVQ